jgi:nicotinate-nucleotide--dimethylbenzimidazole phosphoribosyltransferase
LIDRVWGPIAPPDRDAEHAARARQAVLTKPAGALGRLEDLAVAFAGWQRRTVPMAPRAGCVVFAADHGVAARGVSAYPPEVTAQMVANIARGGAAISVLARALDARLEVVDVGVARPLPAVDGVVQARVRDGTADLSGGPAMTRDDVERALAVGADAARRAVADGVTLLVVGDMGIGNTTAAACLAALFAGAATDEAIDRVVGRGTGIDEARLAHKRAFVRAAVARAASSARSTVDSVVGGRGEANAASACDPRSVLAEVGGLEIVAMAGAMLGAAAAGVPVLLDGFIAAAAALAARALDPAVADWWLAGHRSVEPGHAIALDTLGIVPLLDFDMRLGEGSGAAVAVPIVQLAIALHAQMATFEEAAVAGRA